MAQCLPTYAPAFEHTFYTEAYLKSFGRVGVILN